MIQQLIIMEAAPPGIAARTFDMSGGPVTCNVPGRIALASAGPVTVTDGANQVIGSWWDTLARPRMLAYTGNITITGFGLLTLWNSQNPQGVPYVPAVAITGPVTVVPSTTSSLPLETVVGIDYNRRRLTTSGNGLNSNPLHLPVFPAFVSALPACPNWTVINDYFDYVQASSGTITPQFDVPNGLLMVTRGVGYPMPRNAFVNTDYPLPNGILTWRFDVSAVDSDAATLRPLSVSGGATGTVFAMRRRAGATVGKRWVAQQQTPTVGVPVSSAMSGDLSWLVPPNTTWTFWALFDDTSFLANPTVAPTAGGCEGTFMCNWLGYSFLGGDLAPTRLFETVGLNWLVPDSATANDVRKNNLQYATALTAMAIAANPYELWLCSKLPSNVTSL
jgi:hypothetical protein